MSRQSIFVARAVFPQVLDKLGGYFVVESNQTDTVLSSEDLVQRLQGKAGVLTTTSERIDASILRACPSLKICANMAVGYDNFDIPAMTAAGVLATNTPDVLTETTADMGFALLMATARRLSESEAFLRAGHWTHWSHDMLCGADVFGSTLGILGMGRIGRALALRGALGFDMKVIYHNRSRLPQQVEAEARATYVNKHELFRQADHIVLVLPYSAQTHHTVAAQEIALMKPTATIVNIGRGGLIDESALAAALSEHRILGAGLDVFEGEPAVNPALAALKNVVLTPHIGSASMPTRKAMAHLAADNLIGYLVGGKAKTPINPGVTIRI